MKIFVATDETQGYRANDFCFVPEGEIVMPTFICGRDQSDPDGGCGCGRSLGGVSSFKATTTFRVADITSTPEDLTTIFYQSMVSGSWLKAMSENMLRAHVKAWVQQVLENAAKFPVGSVVEKRLHVYNLRELPALPNGLSKDRDALVAQLRAKLGEIQEIATHQLGEWAGVQPPYLPSTLEGWFDVLEIIERAAPQKYGYFMRNWGIGTDHTPLLVTQWDTQEEALADLRSRMNEYRLSGRRVEHRVPSEPDTYTLFGDHFPPTLHYVAPINRG